MDHIEAVLKLLTQRFDRLIARPVLVGVALPALLGHHEKRQEARP